MDIETLLRKAEQNGCIRQWLIFPWAVFVCKILVKSLSADMKDPAEKGDIPF